MLCAFECPTAKHSPDFPKRRRFYLSLLLLVYNCFTFSSYFSNDITVSCTVMRYADTTPPLKFFPAKVARQGDTRGHKKARGQGPAWGRVRTVWRLDTNVFLPPTVTNDRADRDIQAPAWGVGQKRDSLRGRLVFLPAQVALKPGHSLMDWIRFSKSGKDLTGLRGRRIEVSQEELQKHNKRDDCWTCIRGVCVCVCVGALKF